MALFEIGENRADAMARSDGPVASAVIIAGHGSGPDNSPEALAAYLALDFTFADPLRRGFTIVQLHDAAARHGFASPAQAGCGRGRRAFGCSAFLRPQA